MTPDRRRSGTERRRAPRAPLVAAVLKWRGSRSQLAQTVNIGARGMTLRRVADEDAYPPETPLGLQFQLPGDDAVIEVAADVTFDEGEGAFRTTGVRFALLDDLDARRIAAYVAALTGDSGPRPLARLRLRKTPAQP